ncbi:hypothetical protein DPMN_083628, partial [Dreissena polymorpha]
MRQRGIVQELLSKIHNLSFLIKSKECLEGVRETLSSVVEQITEACPKSGGLLRKQGVAKTETPFVDDESSKENPSEYAIP